MGKRHGVTVAMALVMVCTLILSAGAGMAEEKMGKMPFALMVGDDAPGLMVSKWIQGDPVTKFESGHIYVLDFWATWCRPCVASIPHVAELSKKYAGKATVIGMNVWQPDPAEVEPFVKKMGEKMPYAIATDIVAQGADANTGKMAVGWMNAAGQRGIPAVFIVDGGGKVAWIGHPSEMDEPLEEIVKGTWDLAAYTKTHQNKMEIAAKAAPIEERLFAAAGEQKWEEAIAACDELFALDPDEYGQVAVFKFQMLLQRVGDTKKAYAYAREVIEGPLGKESWALNGIAWYIVDPEFELEDRDLELAMSLATRANDITEGKDAQVLDTLARVYFTKGDVDHAIELQKKAISLVDGEDTKEYEAALAEYEAAK
jgi:thiol-disulfide isomerase/thioredoxin